MQVKTSGEGITIAVGERKTELRVVNKSIIQVRYYETERIKKSESLIIENDMPVFNEWDTVEYDDRVELQTEKLLVVYLKESFSIAFYDRKTGEMILSEKPDDGRKISKTLVEGEETFSIEQTFLSPENEVIGGLGQQQDGAMNYKGRFVNLSQHNIINAVPIIMSSKGYGILWDNCSLSQVNRYKEQIALEFNSFTKTWSCEFSPVEEGEYIFICEKLNRNRGTLEKVEVIVDDVQVITRETLWHCNNYTGCLRLEKGKMYHIFVEGTVHLYYQAPSMRKYTSVWSEIADCIDYYFMYGPDMDAVVDCYRKLTGNAPLFGKWVYGFWQSRERYLTGEELLGILEEYRKKGHPLDNIVQDWQYWGDYGWNALRFHPEYAVDMKSIINKIHDNHAHFMISVWPNFGEGEKNHPYHSLHENAYLMDDSVLNKHMCNFSVSFQGSNRNFYDAFQEDARNILWKHMKEGLFDLGVDAWWLDGSEPNLAGIQGVFHLYRTCKGSAAKFLNAYSLMHSKGVCENQRKDCDRKRVFLLSRTGFAGQQRYASAVWNGDIYSSWDVFGKQISAGINYCLSGLPYWGTDIGGFLGWDDSDPDFIELYIRWFQFGTFCPIFRAHGTNSKREVWQFGQEAENIMHEYLVLRYRLMPYIYSVAWMVTKENYTMLRALMMDFREDANALEINDQFMFGPALMVCPITEKGARTRMVYLPKCKGWYDFWTGNYYSGNQNIEADAPVEKIPLFVRAGSIITIGPEMQYADEKQADPIEMRVYCGKEAAFTLYEDEGDNYNYEKGVYSEIPILWSEDKRELAIGERMGSFPVMLGERTFRVVFIDKDRPVEGSGVTEKCYVISYSGHKIVIKL